MQISTSDIGMEAQPLEFPCDYPVKVMGFASENFQIEVVEIIQRHTQTLSQDKISVRASSKGSYMSVTVVIIATGEDQLRRLFEELKSSAAVKLVL